MVDTPKKIIVVTGGAGFVGSHLCERLATEGHHVISLDNYFTGSSENHISGVKYRTGHTKDIETLVPESPDIIYHLGEYARVEQSVLEPEIVEDLNTEGTQGVIGFWRKAQCKLVYAGSSTKFGDGGTTRHTSPYARTKAENTERVHEIGQTEGLPYAITYFYNVYGPRERSGVYGTVIEHFKRMYLSGTPCAVVSPGTQERNFTHVSDIVEGLIRVGKEGQGDEYGLGCETAHSILDVAHLFNFTDDRIVMFPERPGNRMKTELDTTKAHELGWQTQHSLTAYIDEFTSSYIQGELREKRVLVFSTTMHPVAGLAEDAFIELAKALPDVHFDVVTTRFTREAAKTSSPLENVHIHCVGFGAPIDKFFLPLLGFFKGITLTRTHVYLFAWSLMASYAALAGVGVKHMRGMPILVTLADQSIGSLSTLRRFVFRFLLSRSDQIYGTHGMQEQEVQDTTQRKLPRQSIGEGDAFANALRFAYADIIRQKE